jgi:hypothetical protein
VSAMDGCVSTREIPSGRLELVLKETGRNRAWE